jgi:hypothetical protein
MKASILRSGVAALALGGILASATALPARADTSTTNTIIYGAAAAAAAFTLYNVEHKHQLASTVQGYLPDGSTVYKDGHVVSRNGQTWYPGNYGQTVACSNQYCTIDGSNNGYGYNGYGSGYNNGYSRYNNSNGTGYNNGTRYNGSRYNNANNNGYGYNNNTYDRDRHHDGHHGG